VDKEHHQISGRRQQTSTARKTGEININPQIYTTTIEPAKRYQNAKGVKVDNTTKMAKHPPEQNSSKVSANERKDDETSARRPLQPERCR